MNKHNRLTLLFLVVSTILAHAATIERGWQHLRLSPNGRFLLFDIDSQPGLYLADLADRRTFLLAAGHGAALAAGWSHNERYITFKRFSGDDQIPCTFDMQTGRHCELYPAAKQVGVPSMAGDSLVVFSVGSQLFITDLAGRIRQKLALPAYCNQTPVSPNGRWIVFTDADDQVGLIDPKTGHGRRLTDSVTGYFSPQWSPDGEALLLHRLDGHIVVYHLTSSQWCDLGTGRHAIWQENSQRVLFSKIAISSDGWFQIQGLYSVRADGSDGFFLTSAAHDYVAAAGASIIYADQEQGTLWQVSSASNALHKTLARRLLLDVATQHTPATNAITGTAVVFDIPYVHQTYDTPDWFNGSSACGGTAAVMCLAYYGLLKKWPVTVSTPSRHTSDYGRYVCEKYSYNGFTFDIAGLDPNGSTGYGAFGYIIQNNWQNTKEYMADYARRHGVTSSVDWYPSRSKFKLEMDNKTPVVVLTSLTSAGHYVSGIGYEQEATSVIVNDPWGNKNLGYSNYEGRRAVYDWPGFSNGHSSLETVHCFIYFRSNRSDLAQATMTKADTIALNESYLFSGKIFNLGNSASSPSTGCIVLSTNATFDSTDLVLARFQLPVLQAGDSLNIQQTVVLPDSMLSSTYAFGVMLDDQHRNAELNEANNFGYTRLTVIGRPKLFNFSPPPGSQISETQPLISAFYNDKVSAVDPTSVHLLLDGQDVTASSQVDVSFANYLPPLPLSLGEHRVSLSITNKAGFSNTSVWNFSIAAPTAVPATATQPSTWQWVAYPNPFNHQVTLAANGNRYQPITMKMYDCRGRLVKVLQPGNVYANRIVWDGRDESGFALASGVYFCHILSGGNNQTLPLVLVR
jgi:hypothetical protein